MFPFHPDDPNDITALFTALNPINLSGELNWASGKGPDKDVVSKFISSVLASPEGIVKGDQIIKSLKDLASTDSKNFDKIDNYIFAFTSTTDGSLRYSSSNYNLKLPKENISNLNQILGIPTRGDNKIRTTFLAAASSYLGPHNNNAQLVSTFIQGVPTVIMSRCVPHLDVEFFFTSESQKFATKLKAPSLHKLLLGDTDITTLKGADKVMVNARRDSKGKIRRMDGSEEAALREFVGMELFTSPQTLSNPNREDYLHPENTTDPFKPLMSIESFTVNVTPTVGYDYMKKATLTVRLHDYTRLWEFANLIKPEYFSYTSLWITYGWKYPPDSSPWAKLLNSMRSRECYSIMNSSYSFEGSQVVINLELYTRGTFEFNDIKYDVAGAGSDASTMYERLKGLSKSVKKIAAETNIISKLSAPGVVDIKPVKLINAAERGSISDLEGDDIKTGLKELSEAFKKLTGSNSNIKTEFKELEKSIKDYYEIRPKAKKSIQQIVRGRFDAARKDDPFLPTRDNPKNWFNSQIKNTSLHLDLLAQIEKYIKEPDNKQNKDFRKGVCSFGKALSVFFLAPLLQSMNGTESDLTDVDEIQVFGYPLNSKAGLASGINILSFPIDLFVLQNRITDRVQSTTNERLSIRDILNLIIESQFDDDRSIAYGMRSFYKEWQPDKKELQIKDKEAQNNLLAFRNSAHMKEFQKPSVAIYIEAKPKIDSVSQQYIDNEISAIDDSYVVAQRKLTKSVVRIHLFDRNAHPYKDAEIILNAGSNSVSHTSKAELLAIAEKANLDGTSMNQKYALAGEILRKEQSILNKFQTVNVNQVRNTISRMVPTITYGTETSNITSLSLSSKQDALLATVQMQKMASKRDNTQSAGGANSGVLPLLIVPAELSMTIRGCPLVSYMQTFYLDLKTGTTADNLYGVNRITHTIGPGKFETSLHFSFTDAWGKYVNASSASQYISDIIKDLNAPSKPPKGNGKK